MNIGGGFNAGLLGIQKGVAQLEQSAQTIASVSSQSESIKPLGSSTSNSEIMNLTDASIGLMRAELQVSVSSKVISTENKMIGSLLDIRA